MRSIKRRLTHAEHQRQPQLTRASSLAIAHTISSFTYFHAESSNATMPSKLSLGAMTLAFLSACGLVHCQTGPTAYSIPIAEPPSGDQSMPQMTPSSMQLEEMFTPASATAPSQIAFMRPVFVATNPSPSDDLPTMGTLDMRPLVPTRPRAIPLTECPTPAPTAGQPVASTTTTFSYDVDSPNPSLPSNSTEVLALEKSRMLSPSPMLSPATSLPASAHTISPMTAATWSPTPAPSQPLTWAPTPAPTPVLTWSPTPAPTPRPMASAPSPTTAVLLHNVSPNASETVPPQDMLSTPNAVTVAPITANATATKESREPTNQPYLIREDAPSFERDQKRTPQADNDGGRGSHDKALEPRENSESGAVAASSTRNSSRYVKRQGTLTESSTHPPAALPSITTIPVMDDISNATESPALFKAVPSPAPSVLPVALANSSTNAASCSIDQIEATVANGCKQSTSDCWTCHKSVEYRLDACRCEPLVADGSFCVINSDPKKNRCFLM